MGKYKIAVRNINDNDVEIFDFRIEKDKNKTELMLLDEFLGQYESKEKFLKECIVQEDVFNYDVYIIYKFSAGYKFLDSYFGKNLSCEEYRNKMIDNILNKGLRQEGFVDYLKKEHSDFYKKFDHYNGNCFQYNNINRYFDNIVKCNYNQANVYKNSIKDKLENEYNRLRKMTDYAYRYNNENLKANDEARRNIDYNNSFSNLIIKTPGQLTIYNCMVLANEPCDIVCQLEPRKVEFSEYLLDRIKGDLQAKDIINLYFELLDNSNGFIDAVYDSSLPKTIKDKSYMYKNNLGLSYEDDYEAESQKKYVKTKLYNNKNYLKTAGSLVKEYITNLNSKKL